MRIVLVTPLLDHGGGQKYIANLSNYWVSLGHDVTIIHLRSGKSFFTLSEKIKIIHLNYYGGDTIKKIFTGFKAGIKLRNAIKKETPDFVLSILSSTNIFTLLFTRFLKVKIFVREAMSPYRKRSKIERILRKILYKKAAGVIVMTQKAKKFVSAEIGINNVSVIPNPVKKHPENVSTQKEKIVIDVGRLTAVKGQLYFLEACAKINRPDWKFVILGDGEYRSKLEEKIKELNIENNVVLAGAVKNVHEWLAKSMIFTSTSLSEAWGNAICEAMATGLPVVSFNCEVSPDEIIDDGEDGFLVPLQDVDELSNKIEMLMDDEELRTKIGRKAKLKMERYNIESISNQVLEFCTN
ncbi:glycosyltransferase family 4 protein [Aureibaculum marinum]|uniref:Glycosyltransferase family 4 protein n=1 Tax=Aureibaculum marinum TaxID=2487930 RepID=A0A3N4NDI0_9FLAO|nr:glycosyltransferase family 4 protein [Aureibaculum marinum]RPD94364.1 glycosyltransferase family 4 protein [Aureibaculum marinum]